MLEGLEAILEDLGPSDWHLDDLVSELRLLVSDELVEDPNPGSEGHHKRKVPQDIQMMELVEVDLLLDLV